MSNHVATITKDEGRCSFSRKALSVFMAVLLAFLMMPMVPAESASAATDAEYFSAGHATYTVQPGDDGSYSVPYTGKAAAFGVDKVYMPDNSEVSSQDYTVVYYVDANGDGELGASETPTNTSAGTGAAAEQGAAPTEAGSYLLVVVNGGDLAISDIDTASEVEALGCIVQGFTVQVQSLEGAYAYEKKTDAEDVSDTEFVYDGTDQTSKIGFAVDGKALESTDYTATWNAIPQDAGSYTVTLVGKGTYAGSVATVTVEIAKLDLSAADVSISDIAKASATATTALTVNVDGKQLGNGLFQFVAVKWVDASGATKTGDGVVLSTSNTGSYTYLVQPASAVSDNIVGSKECTFKVVDTLIATDDFTYDGNEIQPTPAADFETFNLSATPAETFDPTKIAVTGATHGFDYTVTKDGQEVEEWSEPGTYVLTVSVKHEGYDLGGTATGTFTVVQGIVTDASVFMVVDGKNIANITGSTPYTGGAIEPTVIVMNGKTALTEGTDYSVEYTLDGEAVDQIVDVDEYVMTVKFEGAYSGNDDVAITFNVAALPLLSGSVQGDIVAYTGEAVSPVFVGYTKADQAGKSFVLGEDDYTVTYADEDGTPVAADDLVEAGKYTATVTPKGNFTGSAFAVPFEILETAHFADVAADAWYAADVYKAYNNDYMKGIAEGIFAPENEMTRAEFAKLVFNMAGNADKSGLEFPTQFADVPANAWYAQAVEWAARYGIVNGTSETTFAPNETISREQIAAMFYRYAGNGAEADLSVLDQFDDADQISAYAENAMAWAVENGYVNGVSDTALAPSETATRAQIAAIAVRVQPEEIA